MTLDEIRADIMTRLDLARRADAVAVQNIAMAEAELEAHDRAVAAMGNGAEKPARAPRRDIGALVREALTHQPQTVAQIAEKVGVPPSRALLGLKRLGITPDASQRWVAP
jgi:hypothetical protein